MATGRSRPPRQSIWAISLRRLRRFLDGLAVGDLTATAAPTSPWPGPTLQTIEMRWRCCWATATGRSRPSHRSTSSANLLDAAEEGGPSVASLMPGDFTGDGRTDLAVVLAGGASGEEQIEVLMGDGDGTFQATAPAYYALTDFVSGDFTGDGRTDLAAVSQDLDGIDRAEPIQVLLGNGDGTFRPRRRLAWAYLSPSVGVSADFTGDGRDDLAVAGESDVVQ